MNTELLRRIQEQILKEPLQFVMGNWFQFGLVKVDGEDVTIPNCGTAACIAGWALTLSRGEKPAQASVVYHESNMPLMPIPILEPLQINMAQADRLCFFRQWPKQFMAKDKNDPKQAVARIEHFIKTKGEE